MSSFEKTAERSSSKIAAATAPDHSLPTDAALSFHMRQRRFKRIAAESRNRREELAAMLMELQANRTVLDGLVDWYGLFVFTGGVVPTAQWNLLAMNSYLEHPLAADRISTAEIQRYRDAAGAISELGQAEPGPRTLRCRHDLGDRFGQAASEIRVLTGTLQAAVAKACGGLESLPQSSDNTI
jgi:hypothetical protein